VSGSGDVGNPYLITGTESIFAASSIDDTMNITPAGTSGHTPDLGVRIDPAGTAPVSFSPAGIRIDCCGGGQVNFATGTVAADYGIVVATDHTILVDATLNNVTVSLPSIASTASGDQYVVMDKFGQATTFTITVDTADAALISGGPGSPAATYVFTIPYESVTFQTDGSNWYIV
jgi:hypothetical protein